MSLNCGVSYYHWILVTISAALKHFQTSKHFITTLSYLAAWQVYLVLLKDSKHTIMAYIAVLLARLFHLYIHTYFPLHLPSFSFISTCAASTLNIVKSVCGYETKLQGQCGQ